MSAIDRILDVMRKLRDPDDGCPWDVEQDFASIAPYTIEEAYEVADAVQTGDMQGLQEELGDLLLQVVFHAQMADESGLFNFDDVANGIADKMIRRHPHVFGNASLRTADEQTAAWEEIKANERAQKGTRGGLLSDVPRAMAALMRAQKLQKRAAKVGFDWPSITQVIDKIREELDELEAEAEVRNVDRLEDELGDVLFAVVNLARHFGVDADKALRRTNQKFIERFGYVERAITQDGRSLSHASLDEMEQYWQAAKTQK